MLSLILAMLVQAQPIQEQSGSAAPTTGARASGGEARAALEGCVMENGRWVCRYTMPALEIVPTPDSGAAQVYTNATVPAPVASPPPASVVAPAATAATTADAVVDPGVLNEREQMLVSRCADAGWMSLCLPAERREARVLRDRHLAYQAVRLQVTGLMSQNQCEAAVRTALQTGNLGLAREARDFCAGQATTEIAEPARTTPPA